MHRYVTGDGEVVTVHVRKEVLLSAGAIMTPKLLLQVCVTFTVVSL
jgi:hypothetical protein